MVTCFPASSRGGFHLTRYIRKTTLRRLRSIFFVYSHPQHFVSRTSIGRKYFGEFAPTREKICFELRAPANNYLKLHPQSKPTEAKKIGLMRGTVDTFVSCPPVWVVKHVWSIMEGVFSLGRSARKEFLHYCSRRDKCRCHTSVTNELQLLYYNSVDYSLASKENALYTILRSFIVGVEIIRFYD